MRGGTRPPPSPGPESRRLLQGGKSRQRLSWESLTSLGATTATPSSGSFGAATHRRPAPAPNIYPHPWGRGGRAGQELGPGGAPAPATPPLRRRDEWLPARGGVATTRPDTSAPTAQATRRARRGAPRRSGAGGAGPLASLILQSNGDGARVLSVGGPAPQRPRGWEGCTLRSLGGASYEPG